MHGYGYIRKDGKIAKSLYHYKHSVMSKELGFKGEFDALSKGAVRFSMDSAGIALEVHWKHTRGASKLVSHLGEEHSAYFLDISDATHGGEYNVLETKSFKSFRDLVSFLNRCQIKP
jgi:hypothetical protein